MHEPQHKRVVVKISGEALMGEQEFGISPDMLRYVAEEVRAIVELGVQTAIVVGGGNIFRGASEAARHMNRAVADSIGMIATVINSLMVQEVAQQGGSIVVVVTPQSDERIDVPEATRALEHADGDVGVAHIERQQQRGDEHQPETGSHQVEGAFNGRHVHILPKVCGIF